MGEGLKWVIFEGGGGVALKGDDRREEMQIFPLCLFFSI